MGRPRLLLVPAFTELEWGIRPLLEKWADVISFDLPGVGAEPAADRLDRQIVVERALEKLDRLGWRSCFVVGDGWGIATAVQIAVARLTLSWGSRSATRSSPTDARETARRSMRKSLPR